MGKSGELGIMSKEISKKNVKGAICIFFFLLPIIKHGRMVINCLKNSNKQQKRNQSWKSKDYSEGGTKSPEFRIKSPESAIKFQYTQNKS